jgi:formamidopyrimidine-DNA glycosylase
MPELPEVETYRRYLEATALHQPITGIDVEDTKLLLTDYDTFARTLTGRSFTDTYRVGKQLFVRTDAPVVLTMHFGMTGDLAYYRDEEDRPRHARVVFHFANGFKLGFICPRKFERLGLTEDIGEYCRLKGLGTDALRISPGELESKLANKKAPVKPVLLDQRVLAGIGNWIADEVLFQARIHPETPAMRLSESDVQQLHSAIQYVLNTAIAHEAEYRYFPSGFIIHAREWDQSPHTDAEAHLRCPRCGNTIDVFRVGGRATYACPVCQERPAAGRGR